MHNVLIHALWLCALHMLLILLVIYAFAVIEVCLKEIHFS